MLVFTWPKTIDIVLPGTGYLASKPEEYANFIEEILRKNASAQNKIQEKARTSAERFSEEVFEEQWINHFCRNRELFP